MKKFFCFLLSFIIMIFPAVSQETDLLDMDFNFLDSIFDEPDSSASGEISSQQEEHQIETSLIDSLRRRGLEFSFSYQFMGAVNPGWAGYYPWEENAKDNFSWSPAVSIASSIGINARISSAFRVNTVINLGIPGSRTSITSENSESSDPAGSHNFSFSFIPNITLGDFFFDYSFFEVVYLRAGKVEQAWGISPNFGFTNILSRIPDSGAPSGPSYLVRFDIPAGVGGFQLLAQTRTDISGGVVPSFNSFGFGGKFNLAFQWADFHIGALYQKNMATRALFTAKTTLWDFEIYNEWLVAFNTHSDNDVSFACNLGFFRSFFNNRLDVNAEFFYNGEGRKNFYRPESEYELSGTSRFLDGFNAAFNLLYRFRGWGNPRLFTRFLYGENSYNITPGVRITPLSNLEIYFAAPMTFGNGYYKNSATDIRGESKPFSFLIYVTFSGDLRAGYYY